ncbi:MAG: cold-shock protein [Propionibacteriaceae bacterium]|jgi:CspA family cold shock protein|nr:cold-shock protein [Propionibacteriaceae bacterium]
MPTGKVRFYDPDKGFGFIAKDDGGDVYVRASVLPPGVPTLKAGQRVEFGVADGRRGEQALSLTVLEAPESLSQAQRKSTEQMTVITEDLIRSMDTVSNDYRRGRYPDPRKAEKLAQMLRWFAAELEL